MIQAPSSTDVPSTPVKKRQCTLLEAFSGEKRPRTTETTETLQESSHKKLRSKLSGQGFVAFEEELKNLWTRHDELGQQKHQARLELRRVGVPLSREADAR